MLSALVVVAPELSHRSRELERRGAVQRHRQLKRAYTAGLLTLHRGSLKLVRYCQKFNQPSRTATGLSAYVFQGVNRRE
jgi:hypothetical protein